MRDFAYHIVDVFTQEALAGNPLAVFPRAEGLDTQTMQKIARECNLSETTFVFPASAAGAAANVRIFTPVNEMVFAGHPTIGTAYVLRKTGAVASEASRFVLEERVGPVAVRVDGGDDPRFWLTCPPIAWGALFDRSHVARTLGISTDDMLTEAPPQLLTAGNPNIFIALRDPAAVDRCAIQTDALRTLLAPPAEPACLFVFAPTPAGAYARMFAPDFGVAEDPATGSATGPLAAFMMKHGLTGTADGTRFVSEQGTRMGRRSLLYVLIHGPGGRDGIEVGGHVAPVAVGTMTLPAA